MKRILLRIIAALTLAVTLLPSALQGGTAYAEGEVYITITPNKAGGIFVVGAGDGVDVKLQSVSIAPRECLVDASIADSTGKTLWRFNEKVMAAPQANTVKRIAPLVNFAGTYTMNVKVYADGKSKSFYETVYYVNSGRVSSLGIAGSHMGDADTLTDSVVSGGFGWVAHDIAWTTIETTKGTYNWDNNWDIIKRIDDERSKGLNVLIVLAYGNTLYEGSNDKWIPTTTAGRTGFANYCAFVVNQLKSHGVTHFCVWNEPNTTAFTGNNGSNSTQRAANYANILKAAYPAIKGANASATVIGGRVSGRDGTFITSLLSSSNGARSSYDVFSYHPYTAWNGVMDEISQQSEWHISNSITYVRNILDTNGGTGKPLWITEVGYSTGTLAAAFANVTEDEKAAYNARYGIMVLADGRIGTMFYYGLYDGMQLEHFDFIERLHFAPYPTYYAVSAVTKMLGGKTLTTKTEPTGRSAYLFADGSGNYTIAAWAKGNRTASSSSVTLGSLFSTFGLNGSYENIKLHDWYGNAVSDVSASTTLNLTYKPSYITFSTAYNLSGMFKSISLAGGNVSLTGETKPGTNVGVLVLKDKNKPLYVNQFKPVNGQYGVTVSVAGLEWFKAVIGDRFNSYEKEYDFLDARITGLKMDGVDVTSISQITDGTLRADMVINNPAVMSSQAVAAVCYYSGEQLVQVITAPVVFGSNAAHAIFANVVPEAYTSVKVIFWDSFATIKPLARAYELKYTGGVSDGDVSVSQSGNVVTITGELNDGSGERLTLIVLKSGHDFNDANIPSGALLHVNQIKTNGKNFAFSFTHTGAAGSYKACINGDGFNSPFYFNLNIQ